MTLHTNHGDIVIDLFGNHAPKTVETITGLAQGTTDYSAKNAKGGASRKAGTGHTADDPGSGRSDAVQAGGSARAAEASGVGDSQDSVMSRAPRRAQNPD